MSETTAAEIVQLTRQLLESIAAGDWETYRRLCDPTLSAFEPEAGGHLIEGMGFHRFYFDLESARPSNTTISSPHVRFFGPDVALIALTRLVQLLDESGKPRTAIFQETRLWQRQDGQWRHVHFHRSTEQTSGC